MKVAKSKAQERQEIESQIRFYLQQGGEVEAIETGVSGRPIGAYSSSAVSFNRPPEPRTSLLNEVKAIEARKIKHPSQTTHTAKIKLRPRKVLITDDFGEPLRWSWQD